DVTHEAEDVSQHSCLFQSNNAVNYSKCYYFQIVEMTQIEALETCKSKNLGLLTIRDAAENNYVNASVMLNVDYWTAGVRSTQRENNFTWENGDLIAYGNWAASEPKLNINESCISIRNGQWFINRCDKKFSVICEKKMKYLQNEQKATLTTNTSTNDFITTFRANLSTINKQLDIYKARDNRLIMLFNDIIDGTFFLQNESMKTESYFNFNENKSRTK
ncbi:macrophage mannose receptor 1-like protein, partial [Leptotrombidium deliense]